MRRTTGNTLHDSVVRMNNIYGTNTPTLVVPILSIVHTNLPPVIASVTSPPLTTNIAVIESPVRDSFGIGFSGSIIAEAAAFAKSVGAESAIFPPAAARRLRKRGTGGIIHASNKKGGA